MNDEIMYKYIGLNEALKSSNEELMVIEEELEKSSVQDYNSEIVAFLVRRKEELLNKIKRYTDLLNIFPLINEKLNGKDRLMFLLVSAEDEFYSLDEQIDDTLESSTGYDNEDLYALINRRDKLALKIYYCRDLLELNDPDKEKILQK